MGTSDSTSADQSHDILIKYVFEIKGTLTKGADDLIKALPFNQKPLRGVFDYLLHVKKTYNNTIKALTKGAS